MEKKSLSGTWHDLPKVIYVREDGNGRVIVRHKVRDAELHRTESIETSIPRDAQALFGGAAPTSIEGRYAYAVAYKAIVGRLITSAKDAVRMSWHPRPPSPTRTAKVLMDVLRQQYGLSDEQINQLIAGLPAIAGNGNDKPADSPAELPAE